MGDWHPRLEERPRTNPCADGSEHPKEHGEDQPVPELLVPSDGVLAKPLARREVLNLVSEVVVALQLGSHRLDLASGRAHVADARVYFGPEVVDARHQDAAELRDLAREMPDTLDHGEAVVDRHLCTVPRDAVNDGPDGSYVYVVENDKAVSRAVKILFDDTQNVAVSGDLKSGDEVITEGQLRVDPDGPVRVIGGKADAPAAADSGKKRGRGKSG